MEGNNNYYYYYYYDDNPPFSNRRLLLLNEDCLIQILLWLPVISLLRFKSVCKSWRAIIQNPFFIHTHHATTTSTSTNKQLVFLRYSDRCYRSGGGDILSVSGPEFEVLEDLGIPGPEFEEEEVLEYSGRPNSSSTYYNNNNNNNNNNRNNNNNKKKKNSSRRRRYQNISMAGCCNGIICLHSYCCGPNWLHLKEEDNPKCCTISLWNPAIKQQYRFLPIPFALEEKNHDGENLNNIMERILPLEGKTYDEENLNDYIDRGLFISAHYVEHFVGFGFDVTTKDYKVLLITYDIYEERQYFYARGVQVYSLSTDSWKCIDASHAQPNLTICDGDDWRQGHCLNGSYLFIGGYLYEGATNSRQQGRQEECFNPVIMSFDFTKEIFRTIELPFDFKLETDKYRKSADIILFGEKIAVTNVCEELYYATACLDIWVLNENIDGSESWSKFYTFVSEGRPKFITDNGEFILLDPCKAVPKLELLNIVTEEIKDLKYDSEGPSNGMGFARAGVYKPSLLPIGRNGKTDNCLHVQV